MALLSTWDTQGSRQNPHASLHLTLSSVLGKYILYSTVLKGIWGSEKSGNMPNVTQHLNWI